MFQIVIEVRIRLELIPYKVSEAVKQIADVTYNL